MYPEWHHQENEKATYIIGLKAIIRIRNWDLEWIKDYYDSVIRQSCLRCGQKVRMDLHNEDTRIKMAQELKWHIKMEKNTHCISNKEMQTKTTMRY